MEACYLNSRFAKTLGKRRVIARIFALISIVTLVKFTFLTEIASDKYSIGKNNYTGARRCITRNVSEGIEVNTKAVVMKEVAQHLKGKPHRGGWAPIDCKREIKVAIIVPYRNRPENLSIFLRHMHNFLQRQKRNYQIFIIEQSDDLLFNRGSLLNIGYKEIQKYDNFTCLIFHDLDMLSEHTSVGYDCIKSGIIHLSSRLSVTNYTLPYKRYIGGVLSISPRTFQKLNGYANTFWGCGGEDDELVNRIEHNGIKLYRLTESMSRYHCLSHGNSKQVYNKNRFKILESSSSRYSLDGLNDLVYDTIEASEGILFVKISVSLLKLRSLIHKEFDI